MTKPGKMLCYMDLNNRRTGKDKTKPRTLGLLEHRVLYNMRHIRPMSSDTFLVKASLQYYTVLLRRHV